MFFPSTAASIAESFDNATPKECIAFIRVSSRIQTDGVSLDAQIDNIRKWAVTNGITIIRTFQVIGSGRDMEKHSQFKTMMRILKAKKYGCCLVVNSVDRFGRCVISGNSHLHQLLRVGVHFCSVSENLYVRKPRSVEAHRFTQLIQAADIESTRISERVNGANAYLKRLGWRFGRCPYGYHVEFVDVDRTDEGLPPRKIRTFVKNEEEGGAAATPSTPINYDREIYQYIRTNYTHTAEQLRDVLYARGMTVFDGIPLTLQKITLIKMFYTPSTSLPDLSTLKL